MRPCIFDNIDGAKLPAWTEQLGDVPTVYASLGTVFNSTPGIFEALLEGLRDEPIHLVLTVGRNLDPARFGPQPANVHIEPYIPQSLMFERCDLVITHGGYNTVMAALTMGVPMLFLPVGGDAPFQAGCCAQLGVATSIVPAELTAESLRAQVRQMLAEKGYRERAAAVKQAIAAMPGPERVVSLLEDLSRKGVA